MKKILLPSAALLIAVVSQNSFAETPNPLSDADLERILNLAVSYDTLNKRNNLYYKVNKSAPFTGWAKQVYDSGQVSWLFRVIDGKADGLYTRWYKNGQKAIEQICRKGWVNGLSTGWHEHGQKRSEKIYKDGTEVSSKYWNGKGDRVETWEEAIGKPTLEGLRSKLAAANRERELLKAEADKGSSRVRNQWLQAKVIEWVPRKPDLQTGGFAIIELHRAMPPGTILAIRKGGSIYGRLKVDHVYADKNQASANPVPGTFTDGKNPDIKAGDELILPPFGS